MEPYYKVLPVKMTGFKMFLIQQRNEIYQEEMHLLNIKRYHDSIIIIQFCAAVRKSAINSKCLVVDTE